MVSLLESLQDIVSNIQIESDFCISHPNYKPLELPSEVVSRFQMLPRELRQKYLNLQLQNFLHGIYYNGSLRDTLALDTEESKLDSDNQNWANDRWFGFNLQFYEQLHRNNRGEGYFDSGWLILKQEEDGSLAVQKNDLTLHVDRTRHLKIAEQLANVGDTVAIKMPPNLLEQRFYIAVGNAGLVVPDSKGDRQTVNIYFNFTPEGAVAMMGSLTEQLNERSIPFTFKVLDNPSEYKCYDSGILCFEKRNYEQVRQVLQSLYRENQSHFGVEVPLFTKLLAPGLALSEEPNYKFTAEEDFGMNRCCLVANALLKAQQKKDNSKETRLNFILENFSSYKIELDYPYLNPESENIYTPL